MREVKYSETIQTMNSKKHQIARILTQSFADNQSTTFVVGQGRGKDRRLQVLLNYSLFYGERFTNALVFRKWCAFHRLITC